MTVENYLSCNWRIDKNWFIPVIVMYWGIVVLIDRLIFEIKFRLRYVGVRFDCLFDNVGSVGIALAVSELEMHRIRVCEMIDMINHGLWH